MCSECYGICGEKICGEGKRVRERVIISVTQYLSLLIRCMYLLICFLAMGMFAGSSLKRYLFVPRQYWVK